MADVPNYTTNAGMVNPLAGLNSGYGIYQGLQQGGARGDINAGLSAGKLGSQVGAYDGAGESGAAGINNGLGAANNLYGIYNGLQRGGVVGGAGALSNSAALYGNLSGLSDAAGMGSFAGGSAIGAAGGYVAAPLAVYNAIHNYKSGATGSDAMQGASAGAAVGSIIPGVGTLIGAGVGAAAGALASAFGGGTTSQEGQMAQHYTGAFDKLDPAAQQQVAAMQTPAQNVQYLQGLMNAHAAGDGGMSDLQAAFGKNDVAGFTTGMTSTINQALQAGKIPPNATASQIYSQVVQPWLASKAGGATSGKDVKGNATSTAEQAAVTNLIGQWQSGALSSNTAVGVKGQKISIPAWAGGSSGPATSPQTAQGAPGAPQTPPPNPLAAIPQGGSPMAPMAQSGMSGIGNWLGTGGVGTQYTQPPRG